MTFGRATVAALWLVAVACSRADHGPRTSAATQAPPSARSVRERLDTVAAPATWEGGTPLRTYQGQGFTLEYPAGATFDTGSSYPTQIAGTVITGPNFSMTGKFGRNVEPDARSGPAYKLVVAVLPNPDHLTLEQFVDSSVNRYNAKLGPDFPIGQATSYRAVLGGQVARVVQPPCGDCWPRDVYFGRGNRVVVLSFSTDDTDMLDALTAPLYWLVISTFRWAK